MPNPSLIAMEEDQIGKPVDDTDLIRKVCGELEDLLVAKNIQYGNSALDPLRLFARGIDAEAQLRVRIDDKLSRMARGDDSIEADTDVYRDLAGYCILWLVLQERGKDGP